MRIFCTVRWKVTMKTDQVYVEHMTVILTLGTHNYIDIIKIEFMLNII